MTGHGEQVSLDRLRQLLDHGEGIDLDFKRACNLNERSELLAIIKDVAAFAATGGHLVVGVNEDGTPSALFDSAQARLFDEATLRAKIAPTYLPDTISITTAVHELDGAPVAIVYVAAHPDGFIVLQRDGDFTDPAGGPRQAFRAGEVYIRRGSSSRVWNHEEASAALQRAMNARRERWRRELTEDLAGVGLGQQAQAIVRGPAAAFTWQLDNDSFVATVIELLRADDDIALSLGFDAIRRDAAAAYRAAQLDTLDTIIDRLTSAAAIGISVARPEFRTRAINGLMQVYNLAYDANGHPRSVPNGIPAPLLWLHVIIRVYGLGGLAVRKQTWNAVTELALQRASGDDYYTNWLRQTLTSASRANLLQSREEDRQIELSLLALAAEQVDRLAPLRPDVPAGDEAIINSLTQFDLLSILAAISNAGSLSTRSWYTNFARYDWARSEPALVELLGDEDMRREIFPRGDDELAAAINEVSRMASGEGFRFAVWGGWRSDTVERFLADHA
jgi:hypothetical protein